MKYIGQVNGAKLDRFQVPFANIMPGWTEEGEALTEAQRVELFPDRGQVFWYRAPEDSHERLVLFEAIEQDTQKDGRDRFAVERADPLLQAVDLKSYGDMLKVGTLLQSSEGLPLQLRGQSPRLKIFIGCSDGWVGPVEVLADQGSHHLDPLQAGLDRLRWYSREPGHLPLVVLGGGWQRVVLPHRPWVQSGLLDWRQDKDVFKAFLKALQKGGTSGLTRTGIRDLVENFSGSGISAAELPLEQFRLERMRSLVRAEAQVERLLSEVQADLLLLPALATLRQEALEMGHTEGAQAARREAEVTLAEARTQAAQFREEARSQAEHLSRDLAAQQLDLENTRQALKAEVATYQSRLAQMEGTEKDLNLRLESLLAEPGKLLAEVAILRPFLQGPSSVAAPAPMVQAESAPWPQAESRLETREQLLEALEDEGLPLPLAQGLLAAFTAGRVPILSGPHAVDVLSRFAKLAFGGRLLRARVSPGMLEPGDLLGKVEPTRGVFSPHPTHTLDWLARVASEGTPSLLVLDGANRAPTEAFLLPWMEVARAHGTLPLYHPLALAGPVPLYAPEFTWPAKALLAVCVVEGPTTLPVSSSLWAHGVLIDTQGFAGRAPLAAQPPAEVLPEFLTLQDPSCQKVKDRFQDRLPEAGDPLYPFLGSIEAYGQALLELGMMPGTVWADLALAILLPASLSLGLPMEPRQADPDLLAAAESWQRRVLL